MKTIKIKNISPVIYRDDIDKNKLYLIIKHGWKIQFIHFAKNDLLDFLKDRNKTFSNLFLFLEYEVFLKQWIKIEWSLTDTDNFIRRFEENYLKDKFWILDLVVFNF